MKFTARFKYDREIALWLSDFIGRALPRTCFPDDVFFDILPSEPRLDAGAYRVFMTIDAGGGHVDIAVTMIVPAFASLAEGTPSFEDVEVTRDVWDSDGVHARTLVWDDDDCSWYELDGSGSGRSDT